MKRKLNWLMVMMQTVLVCSLSPVKSQPPAQGPPQPPLPGVVNSEFPTFLLFTLLKTTVQTNVDTVNARIKRATPTSGVQAHLSFTSKFFKPGMSVTTAVDQPNQNIVRIDCMLEYNITDIHYHGVPYFSRKLSQSITMNISCKNWFAPPGKINIVTIVDKPYLDNASFNEQALNFFLANQLTDLVDQTLRQLLPSAFSNSAIVPNSACSCLGVYPGSAPEYTDGAITYAFKKGPRLLPETAFNKITIALKSIKRLKAHSFEGEVLYSPAEDIQLEFYANHTLRTTSLTQIKEDEERLLNVPVIMFDKPADNGSIVLIGNIVQLPSFNPKDSRFAVFHKNVSFGNGTQKLMIQKTYWTRPQRLPGGGMTKPTEIKVNAYELTIQISGANLGTVIQ